MTTLSLRNLSKTYGDVTVIPDLSLEIADGEFVVFVGPSGCGKSTLIRMIAGLEDIDGGELLIDGVRANDKGPADRDLAMVFQSYALYPHMTVRENMSFALRLARVPRDVRDRKVMDAARVLQLEGYLDQKPGRLSGGQRQRVALGRAMVRDPKVFLFDEPLSNLDAALRGQMRVELARLHGALKATMIYVTHDQVEAMTMADRIVVLRGGRIEQVGAPLDVYRRPTNLFVATFIGSPGMNLLNAALVGVEQASCTIRLLSGAIVAVPVDTGGLAIGAMVTLGIRPEDLRPDIEGPLGGTVTVVEHLGGSSLVYVALAGSAEVIAQVPGGNALRPGDAVSLGFDAARCHVFDEAGHALPPP